MEQATAAGDLSNTTRWDVRSVRELFFSLTGRALATQGCVSKHFAHDHTKSNVLSQMDVFLDTVHAAVAARESIWDAWSVREQTSWTCKNSLSGCPGTQRAHSRPLVAITQKGSVLSQTDGSSTKLHVQPLQAIGSCPHLVVE